MRSYESITRATANVGGTPLPPQGLPSLLQGNGGKFLYAAGAMIYTERICFTSRKSHCEILHIPKQCCLVIDVHPVCL